jgi:transcriptional regulator NrdR family protein
MNCPECGCKSTVLDSKADAFLVARMRQCKTCNHIFYTTEMETFDSHDDILRLRRDYYKERNKIRRGCSK